MANKTPSSSALYNPALPPSVSKHGFLGMVEKIYEYHYLALDANVLNQKVLGDGKAKNRLQLVVAGNALFMLLNSRGEWRKMRFCPDLDKRAFAANGIYDVETGLAMEQEESSRELKAVAWSGVRGVVVLILGVYYLVFTSEAPLQPPTAPLVPQALIPPSKWTDFVDGRQLLAEKKAKQAEEELLKAKLAWLAEEELLETDMTWLAENEAEQTEEELLEAKAAEEACLAAKEAWLAAKEAWLAAKEAARAGREVVLIERFDDGIDAGIDAEAAVADG